MCSPGAGEMAWSVKGLLSKHEDPTPNVWKEKSWPVVDTLIPTLEAGLVHIVSYETVSDVERDSVSKEKNEKKRERQKEREERRAEHCQHTL